MNIRYVDAEEVTRRLDMNTCIAIMRQVFSEVVSGSSRSILRSVVPMNRGILGIMPAVLPDQNVAGAKLITVVHDNASRSLPGHQGIVAAFNASDGSLLGICDGTAITAIRTAAVSALATDVLANSDVQTLCILGSGVQADMHLNAICRVRPIRIVKVWSRSIEHAERFSQKWQSRYPDISIRSCTSAQEAVEGADIICTVTPSSTPILQGEWVKVGAHINAVGACAAKDRELDSECIRRAKLVCDSEHACRSESGDFLIPLKEGVIGEGHLLASLGDVITRRKRIRTSVFDITCFESLGLAEEDLACATYLLEMEPTASCFHSVNPVESQII